MIASTIFLVLQSLESNFNIFGALQLQYSKFWIYTHHSFTHLSSNIYWASIKCQALFWAEGYNNEQDRFHLNLFSSKISILTIAAFSNDSYYYSNYISYRLCSGKFICSFSLFIRRLGEIDIYYHSHFTNVKTEPKIYLNNIPELSRGKDKI